MNLWLSSDSAITKGPFSQQAYRVLTSSIQMLHLRREIMSETRLQTTPASCGHQRQVQNFLQSSWWFRTQGNLFYAKINPWPILVALCKRRCQLVHQHMSPMPDLFHWKGSHTTHHFHSGPLVLESTHQHHVHASGPRIPLICLQ